jgi:hypothetical protein
MNLTITPLIRIAALIGLVAILALGGGVLLLGRSHSTTTVVAAGARHGSATAAQRKTHVTPAATHAKTKTAVKTAPPTTHAQKTTPATAHKTTPATVHKTATQQKAATKHKATAQHTTTPQHTTTTQHKTATKHTATPSKPAKFRGNPVYADLPAALQWELSRHKVVVVSFYDPNADVDAISVAEAHAGAITTKAGFLLVSVLDNKVAGILTALLPEGGLLPEPGVIIYRAPGTIVQRMDGFVDRDSVAQAATNALAAPAPATAPAATATP